MPAGDETTMIITGNGDGNESKRALAAILFIAAGTNAMDVYSALNSSPWTAESFGGDPQKAKACKEYVYHSLAVTIFYGGVSSIIAHSLWPIIGTLLIDAYMYYLYMRALGRAVSRGSTGWSS